jgi:multicomponent Na+:H+ antiporter subunit D
LKMALVRGRFELAIIIILGGLLAAAYLFRLLAAAFDATDDEQDIAPQVAVPRVQEYSTLALALCSLLLGLFTWPVIELLWIGSPWQTMVVDGIAP